MIQKKLYKKLKSWGIPLNNMNVFQKRAQARDANKFSNSIPKTQVVPRQDGIVEEEISEPTQNIFQKHAQQNKQKEEEKFGFWDTIKDIGQQVVSKGIAGVGGAYGNILDTFGLQLPEGQNVLPGQEQIYNIQSGILDKMNRGEAPSFSELMLLSDDDLVPNFTRLPKSRELQKGIKDLTGIGEGKTEAGRIAGRGAEFVGEGAATGGGLKALVGLGLSGVAGQGIRESGGPEWAATTTEIGGSLLPSVISKKLVPTGKGARDVVDAGRKIGLTEAQITPLIQSEKKVANLSKVARKGSKTKELFGQIKEKLGDSYTSIKGRPDAKIKLPNAEQINIRKEFGNIRNELSKTLAPSPEREAALHFIEKSLETLRNTQVSPEYLVNFWQDINKTVKWNSIQGGKKALAQLKDPISKALQKASPQLAKDFEMTNELYSKYAQISKKLKPDLIDSIINKGELLTAPAAGLALAFGNPSALIGLGTEASIRLLGREMLINPYFQNVAKKLVTNFNSSSMKGVTESVKQVQEYMQRKHPNEDWSFLTRDKEED